MQYAESHRHPINIVLHALGSGVSWSPRHFFARRAEATGIQREILGGLADRASCLALGEAAAQPTKNVNHVEGGFYVHDPSAIMFLIDPTIFTIRKGPVRVVTEGIAIGETIMPVYAYQLGLPPWRGRPDVTTGTDVDVKRFLQTFESVMTRK